MLTRYFALTTAVALSLGSYAHGAMFGSPALPRTQVDQAYQITFIDTLNTAPISGKLASWEIYSGTADADVALQIWRPVGSTYLLVGQNLVTTTTTGVVDFPIAPASQIAVQAGDLLGFRYAYQGRSNRAITFDYTTGGTLYTLDWPNPAEDVPVGGSLVASAFGNPDVGGGARTYSLAATVVVPEPGLAAGPAPLAIALLRRRR